MKTIPPPCPHPETGPKYWRSLDEVAETPEFQEWLQREFPAGASEFEDGVSRRNFVKIMASSFALAGVGLTGCRRPYENIVPFTRMPEGYVHGNANYYATAMPTRTSAIPLVVKSHEGRPIKIEGNAEHPDSNGGTNAWAQASILNLYDVDRAKRFMRGGNTLPREAAFSHLAQIGQRYAANQGAGLAFLTEPRNSPSRQRVQEFIGNKYPQAKWYSYDPVDTDVHQKAASRATGQAVRPYFKFEEAAVIVSLDCDFIGAEEENTRYISGFAKGRRIEKPTDRMNRLYVIEPLLTLTGMNSDHRLRVPGTQVAAVAVQLAQAILNNSQAEDQWIAECAKDLAANRGKVLVVAGHRQPLAVHILAYAINQALGSIGSTVLFQEAPEVREGTIFDLAQALNGGQVQTLVITGGNPVYTAPASLNWRETQRRAREIVRLGYYEDETAAVCDLHIPEAHYLESWGDARTMDGTYVPIQPLIAPLYGGLSEIEVLALVSGAPINKGHDIARDTFRTIAGTDAENDWKKFLHDGFWQGAAAKTVSAQIGTEIINQAIQAGRPGAPSAQSLEVVLYRDYSLDDGRYANNGWLQEMPDPVTKITWENVFLVSKKTANDLGFADEEFMYGTHELVQKDHPRGVPTATVSVGGKQITAPLWLQPGLADNVVGLALGYGRTEVGRIGKGHDGKPAGVNAYEFRTSEAPYFVAGAKLARATEVSKIACTQHHWNMEGRPIIREANYEQYVANPAFARALDLEAPKDNEGNPVVQSLYPNPLEREKNNPRIVHQWGMTIDLNTCVSCQACVIACQSENNIPIVGKDQVFRQREMHWLRLDRYYAGDASNPQVAYQPMLCQHCEAAPCESVCPVNATVHDEEGLNLMVYNRCVGTRYCSNNCPYKVRRFNFFDYHKRTAKELEGPFYTTPFFKKTDGEHDLKKWAKDRDRHWRDDEEWELLKLAKNPEVTVRMRGVMEKCTFCLQRIEAAKIDQKVKAGASDEVTVPDGTIKTACQQVCPADAIVFGNIKDPNSRVSQLKALDRNYQVLDYLYTRPRLTYLAKVRNPNKAMPDYTEYTANTQEYRSSMMSDPQGNPYAGHGAHGAAGHDHHTDAHGHSQSPAAATKGAH
jgi:molybdopterin-containing oxidoreductase family iron-sulfur binding subunit